MKLTTKLLAWIMALLLILTSQTELAQAATGSQSTETSNEVSKLPFIVANPALLAKVHNQIVTSDAIFLGDKDIPLNYLKDYSNYYTNSVVPLITSLFPDFAKFKEKPVFIVTLTAQSALNWTSKKVVDMGAVGVYEGDYLVLMEHPRENIDYINNIIITHEFVHWVVDKVLAKGDSKVPTFINEGMAHNIAWMLNDKRDNWTSTISDNSWGRVSKSREAVPDLWKYEDQGDWVITSVSYLVNKYGKEKLIQYLQQINKSNDAFTKAYGITPSQFQKEFEDEVRKRRAENGIVMPEEPKVTVEAPPRKFSANDVGVRLNGKYIELTPKAKVLNGSTFIPLHGYSKRWALLLSGTG